MKSLAEPLAEMISTITRCPSDEVHVCPYCHNEVPKYPLTLTNSKGVTKTLMVQPSCKCECEAMEKGITEAEERKVKNEIERKFAISTLGDRFSESRFETFSKREGSEKAFVLARQYAMSFPEIGGESLLFWGEPGNGKSHLAAAICHTLKERGFIPVFQSVPALLERIRNTFGGRQKETEKEIMDALRDCDLLVLDDIGAEKISDWVLDVLFRIIDGRYSHKKPTLFTTNYAPQDLLYRFMPEKKELNREDEIKAKRLYDRIIEVSIIVENKASSYRQQVAKERIQAMRR